MGYFKKRREAAEKKRLDILMELFMVQAKAVNDSVNEGVTNAIGIYDEKKYRYAENVRDNLKALLEYNDYSYLITQVAEVIDTQSKVYGYRIAKGKREELAYDILKSLSEEKK